MKLNNQGVNEGRVTPCNNNIIHINQHNKDGRTRVGEEHRSIRLRALKTIL